MNKSTQSIAFNIPMKAVFVLLMAIFALLLTPVYANAQTAAESDSWRQFDKDNNNELSLAEFSSLRIAQYSVLDRNGDGKWSRKEFVKRMPDMSAGRLDSLRGKFKRWDKNDDGYWDTAEASKAINGNFRWLDKNKNKSLAIKEFPKHF